MSYHYLCDMDLDAIREQARGQERERVLRAVTEALSLTEEQYARLPTALSSETKEIITTALHHTVDNERRRVLAAVAEGLHLLVDHFQDLTESAEISAAVESTADTFWEDGFEGALKGVVTVVGVKSKLPEGGGGGDYTVASVADAISAAVNEHKEAASLAADAAWNEGYETALNHVVSEAGLRPAITTARNDAAQKALTTVAHQLVLPEPGAPYNVESFVKAVNDRERSAQTGAQWLTIKHLLEELKLECLWGEQELDIAEVARHIRKSVLGDVAWKLCFDASPTSMDDLVQMISKRSSDLHREAVWTAIKQLLVKLDRPCLWTRESLDLDAVAKHIMAQPGKMWNSAMHWFSRGWHAAFEQISERVGIDPIATSLEIEPENLISALQERLQTAESEAWQDAIREVAKELDLNPEISTVSGIVEGVGRQMESLAIEKRNRPPTSRSLNTLCALKTLQAVLKTKNDRKHPDVVWGEVASFLGHLRDCPLDEPITFLPREVLPETQG